MEISLSRCEKLTVFGQMVPTVCSPVFAATLSRGSKQLVDRLHAVVHHRDGPVLRAGQFVVVVQAEAVVERGGHFRGRDGTAVWDVAQLVGGADDAAAAGRAAPREDGPDAGGGVAAAGGGEL